MELVKINKIKNNPKNPRIIKDHKYFKLLDSIRNFPDMLNKRPLIVFTDKDDKYVVLGGNMRLKALKELKYKEIPVIKADEWTEEQKAEFLIKDNLNYGEWDWNDLANEWSSEKLNDWGLEVPHMDEVNIDDFFADADKINENPDNYQIILQYNEDDYNKVIDLFNAKSGSKENIVLELLSK